MPAYSILLLLLSRGLEGPPPKSPSTHVEGNTPPDFRRQAISRQTITLEDGEDFFVRSGVQLMTQSNILWHQTTS